MTSALLTSRVGASLGETTWGVASIDRDGTDVASRLLPADGDVEIGSISKGVTAVLYRDAVNRGEVRPGDLLRDHLPLSDCAAGAVTLESLAGHRSGLPRLPVMPGMLGRTWRMWRHQENPYGDTLDELLEQTRETSVGRPKPAYSNLGFELLGHAVAAAVAMPYAELVRERLAAPLGLDSWYVPATPADLSDSAVAGATRSGRPAQAWTGEGLGPAGGIRSTLTDLASFAAALLEGRAPGIEALEPRAPFVGSGVRIGDGWITSSVRGREITWHNGGTGGWRSFVGLDRSAHRAAVVVRASTRSVDPVGMELLAT
ncbi:serine hydrolase domain-containing protein [Nocardioides sambongensis]|uniref:serine hydrolase domain-containing protein n=1 Tax=Nocardioides sambongensis TaxID=2589074 RepID=UPI0015E8432D|nr:serine hydrolase domain-containing protein [Nocardioides sambongensis]